MEVHSFIAESAVDAVAQIREQLGPDAVVLNVRKRAGQGLSRLWQKPQIEVLAYVPEKGPPRDVGEIAQLRDELAAIRQKVFTPSAAEETPSGDDAALLARPSSFTTGEWRSGAILENSGLLPLHAQRVVNEMSARYGEAPPSTLTDELTLATEVLSGWWREPQQERSASNLHIFVGTPGSGKTTVLSKWLAQTTLIEEKSAGVWRLDGRTANTAEALSVYCEILNVPVERCYACDSAMADAEMKFVDVPGVNWSDSAAIADLALQLAAFPRCQVHLVLNLAYELPLLLKQLRAFASVPVNDLIFTHLDEEPRWGKIWNFVLGTNYCVSFCGAGQNVPGDFFVASAAKIISRQFGRK